MSDFNKEGLGNIMLVAIAVCLVCSIIVSSAAVALKPRQDFNKALDQKQNILFAAGLLDPSDGAGADQVEALFSEFEVRAVDLNSGDFVDSVDLAAYDPIRAAKDPDVSRELTADEDIATLGRLENVSLVYIKRSEERIEKVVLPVRGYGLWGTLFGYLAIDADLKTISGLGFYDHKETPGLGGEVDNPKWKAQWSGVQLFGASGTPAVRLVKNRSPSGTPGIEHEVDALSGATFTTRGVQNLVNFWTGELGFGPFLSRLQASPSLVSQVDHG